MNEESGEGEDLYANPFFVTLKTKYPDIYATAEKELHTICIPQVSSLPRDIKAFATLPVIGASKRSLKTSKPQNLNHQ